MDFLAFMDLEKEYDRQAMWQVLKAYGLGGEVLASVRVVGAVSGCSNEQWLEARVGSVFIAVQYLHERSCKISLRKDARKKSRDD